MRATKLVFTNGTFDVLHVGHFNLLSYCRKLAGKEGTVVVALDADEKIKKDKGNSKPFFTFQERKLQLEHLSGPKGILVDTVLCFWSNEHLKEIIGYYQPDYLVKGDDWEGNVVGQDIALKTVLLPRMQLYSSSKIIERIQNKKLSSRDHLRKIQTNMMKEAK